MSFDAIRFFSFKPQHLAQFLKISCLHFIGRRHSLEIRHFAVVLKIGSKIGGGLGRGHVRGSVGSAHLKLKAKAFKCVEGKEEL